MISYSQIVLDDPPLDQSSSVVSVQELVATWLTSYLQRGGLVTMLGPKGSYEEYIRADEEVQQLLGDVGRLVDNSEECKKLLDVFKEYAFLWQHDVTQTFKDFLAGYITPNPLRTRSAQKTKEERLAANQAAIKSDKSSQASRASSARSAISQEQLEIAERTFLTPKATMVGEKSNVPSLDEFDQEIDIYRALINWDKKLVKNGCEPEVKGICLVAIKIILAMTTQNLTRPKNVDHIDQEKSPYTKYSHGL